MSSENPESRVPDPLPDPPNPPRPVSPERVIVIPRPPDDIWIHDAPVPSKRKPRTRLALILLLLTCLSTFIAQACPLWGIDNPLELPWLILTLAGRSAADLRLWVERGFIPGLAAGLTYSCCVMAILGAHELGHYLQARRYGVPASLPYFIPFPISPFGTMGAVIVQQSGTANRKSMFDIAISGPLAGLVLALPLAWWGIQHSRVEEFAGHQRVFSNPLLLTWMIEAVHGPMREGTDIALTPVLFAGWVGIFITALNLLPIGQLDGGHILYCLIRRRAHYVARGLFLVAVGFVVFNMAFGDQRYFAWSLMLFLIWLMGTRHPPTANDRMPLGWGRIVLGWVTLMFVVIGLTPMPMYELDSRPKSRPPIRRKIDVKPPVVVTARGEWSAGTDTKRVGPG